MVPPDLVTHCGPPDRREVHQRPVPALPGRSQCTSSSENARTVGFPPQELRDLQLRVRTEQQTAEWKIRYAVRSGVEGTVKEFAHGHGMRRCRYQGQDKAHLPESSSTPNQLRGRATLGNFTNPHQHPVAVFARRSRRRAARRPGRFRRCGRSVA
ncbi:transposase [Streptomyces sp. NPDC048430]|uniref:transposase n=1 Tax=Streptomyces sp. NPDC048430 TaxID=3155388 RepID=UPI00341C8A24